MIITPNMTTKQINKALKNNRIIIFKKGTYNLTKTLALYSNTVINCEPDVVFNRKHGGRMVSVHISPEYTGYNGTHDVSWTGGKFVANTNASSGIGIVICHSKNITFENIEIEGCVGLHSIEINSSNNVKIDNCVITNQTAAEGKKHKEAIQIDYCYKGGLSIAGATAESPCYDDTHCSDITIQWCSFINVPSGIGTHVVSEKEDYHTNITIKECKFVGVEKNDIRLLGMKNVNISNCARNCKIVVDKTKKAHTSHGTVALKDYRRNIGVTIDSISIL